MNETDLARLRALAEKATPGPWELLGANGIVSIEKAGAPPIVAWLGFDDSHRPKAAHKANAAYLAALSPEVVLALLDAVAEGRALGERGRE